MTLQYDVIQNDIHLQSSSWDTNDPAGLYSISLQLHVDVETKNDKKPAALAPVKTEERLTEC